MAAAPAEEVRIDGDCDPRFAAVEVTFAENFRQDEVGAMLAVTLAGRPVVDLWGGYADRRRTRPWRRDTLVCMMSVAKGVTALVAHMLVDRGALDLATPVARYWPEFAAAGKDTLPVRYLLDHRAGLPLIDEPLAPDAVYDWSAMTAALAAAAPLWPPGTVRAYHSVTMGFLVGEVVRRVSGKSLGSLFQDEVATPLALDYHIGLPEAHHGRCAEFFGETAGTLFDASDPASLKARAMAQVPARILNEPRFRTSEIPSINGHGTVRAIARLYGALGPGRRLGMTSACSASRRSPRPRPCSGRGPRTCSATSGGWRSDSS